MALSDVKVRSAKPEAKAYKLTDGDGMVLLVHTNDSKYWRLRYRFGGKEKMLALGKYPEVSLADAGMRRVSCWLTVSILVRTRKPFR